MPDHYSRITEVDPPILDGLMSALELRAADPQLRAMLAAYLSDAALPAEARVLEVGCGTGAVTRSIAAWPGVSAAVGLDPSPVFIARARELAGNLASVTFDAADGRSLPFPEASFHAVVFHTTLCHVPEPQVMLAEAARVLRDGGCVAIFEGDYAAATLATKAGDPLERCAEAFREHFVHDPWLARRLLPLVRAAGLGAGSVRSHSYVETLAPGFMLRSWVDMGADALVASGNAAPPEAEELKAEARRRIANGEYFAHIPYLSLIARKSPSGARCPTSRTSS